MTHIRPEDDRMLHRFLDDDLDPEQATMLHDRLLEEPDLRDALQDLRRTDDLARDATSVLVTRRLAPQVALAPVLLVAIVVAWFAWPRPTSHDPLVDPVDTPESTRIVLSVPIRAPDAPGGTTTEPTEAPSDLALVRDEGPPAELALTTEERLEAFRALAAEMTAAADARAFLEDLPVEQQLEACRVWVHDRRTMVVAFSHLKSLADAPPPGMDALLKDVFEDEYLSLWLRGRSLADPRGVMN